MSTAKRVIERHGIHASIIPPAIPSNLFSSIPFGCLYLSSALSHPASTYSTRIPPPRLGPTSTSTSIDLAPASASQPRSRPDPTQRDAMRANQPISASQSNSAQSGPVQLRARFDSPRLASVRVGSVRFVRSAQVQSSPVQSSTRPSKAKSKSKSNFKYTSTRLKRILSPVPATATATFRQSDRDRTEQTCGRGHVPGGSCNSMFSLCDRWSFRMCASSPSARFPLPASSPPRLLASSPHHLRCGTPSASVTISTLRFSSKLILPACKIAVVYTVSPIVGNVPS